MIDHDGRSLESGLYVIYNPRNVRHDDHVRSRGEAVITPQGESPPETPGNNSEDHFNILQQNKKKLKSSF